MAAKDEFHHSQVSTLQSCFFQSAKKYPDNIAVTFSDVDVQSIKYCDMRDIVISLSSIFKQSFRANEFIGICYKQNIYLPALLLAVLESSAAFYPISETLAPEVIFKYTQKYTIRHILVQDSLLEKICATGCGQSSIIEKFSTYQPEKDEDKELFKQLQITLIEINQSQPGILNEMGWMGEIAYVMQTSGTTGEPKAVFVPHSCILPNIVHLSSIFQVTSQDIVFLTSPYTFDPFIVQMFLAFYNGASLLIVPDTTKSLPELLCSQLFNKHKVTLFQPTPSMLYYIGERLIREKILCKGTPLNVLAIGGESFPPFSTLKKWKHPECKTSIFNIYGITEVSSWATCYHVTNNDIDNATGRAVCPIGFALDGTKIELRHDNGEILDGDGIGHLFIGGNSRKCLLENEIPVSIQVMRTSGDIVERKNGQLRCVGRSDNQIKRFGCRVSLENIEKDVNMFPGVSSCVAVHQPTSLQGNILVHLFVVISDNNLSFGEIERFKTTLQVHMKRVLPRASQPDTVHVIDKIPLTNHGKINKKQLLSWLLFDSRPTQLGLQHVSIEEALVELWRSCFSNTDHITPTEYKNEPENTELGINLKADVPKAEDMFVKKGGDSFKAVYFADKIEQWCKKRQGFFIDLSLLVEIIINKTFADLIKYVKKQIRDDKICVNEVSRTQHESPAKRPMKCNTDDLHIKKMKHSETRETDEKTKYAKTVKSEARRQCVPSERFICLTCHPSKCHHALWNLSNEFIFAVKWRCFLGKCIDASPLVVTSCLVLDGEVFIGSHSHLFAAMSLSTGEFLWKKHLDGRIESSACLSLCTQFVIVGCYDGKIYVLSRKDGSIVWTYQTGDIVKSSPCLDHCNGLIWIGSHDSNLYALDVKRKQCTIQVSCQGGSCFSSPAISYKPHCVYTATLAGHFLSVDVETKNTRWIKQLKKPVFSSPLVHNENIFVSTVDGQFKCFNHEGVFLWEYVTAGTIYSSPAVTHLPDHSLKLIICSHNCTVYCISDGGQHEWSKRLDGPIYSTPRMISRITDTVLLLTITTKGTLYILDMKDGCVLKTFSFSGEIFSSPTLIHNHVVVGCRDDYLYCLNLT